MAADAKVRVVLSAVDYASNEIEQASSEVEGSLEGVSDAAEETSDSLFELNEAGLAVGAGMTAMGYATDKALQSTRNMREEAHRTATRLGETQESVQDMATEMSNATFPVEDAIYTLSSLSRQGVQTREDLMELSIVADRIGDATGTSAKTVADSLVPAMRGLGHETEELVDLQDYMVQAINTTTMSMTDFGQTIERAQGDLTEFDIGIEEVSGMLAVFQDQTGLSGRYLRREFGQAVRAADGDLEELYRELGLSQKQVSDWRKQVEDADDITGQYANSVRENVTWADELRSSFEDLKLGLFDTLGPLRNMLPLMQALGPLMMAYSTINFKAVIPSIMAKTKAIWAMNAAFLANPIGLVIAAVAGLIAVLIILEKRFGIVTKFIDWFSDAVSVAWDYTKRFFGWIKDVAFAILKAYIEYWKFIINVILSIPEILGKVWDFLSNFLSGMVSSFREGVSDIVGWFRELPRRIYEAIKGIFGEALEWGMELAKSLVEGLVDGIKGLGGSVKDSITGALGFNPTLPEIAGETGEHMGELQLEKYEEEMQRVDVGHHFEPDTGVGAGVGRDRRVVKEVNEFNIEVKFEDIFAVDSKRAKKEFIGHFGPELVEYIRRHGI